MRRIVSGASHSEWTEQFALAEAVESFVGDALECHAKDDETDVAIFGFAAGIGCERRGESGSQQVRSSFLLQE